MELGYTAVDVAQALQRLSGVAAARGLVAPSPPEEVQQRWSIVATVAGDGTGELDPVSLEHLKVIYNYIETTIISCGAPDSFEVYEVCFETLSKIGIFLQSHSSKELLFALLETVHEVYDVLLSCVETYEWVQPGATGLLRLWMLQVVFACFGFRNITGRHLMELTDNDVSGAVSLVSFMLRCGEAPFDMQASAGRCLEELTFADSVFLSDVAGGEDWQNQAIAKLTGMLNKHVNGLIKGIIQFDVVEAFGRCICQHQMSHARTDVIVKLFLTTIHNCLLYCSENQKKLRQHLATQSTVVQDIMVPYVHNILPALYDNPAAGPASIEWQNLKSVLQTFVVVTFNINVFRPQLRDTDMLPRISQVPNILTHISMLELLIKISLNVDISKGPYFDILIQTLQAAFAQLPVDSQKRLQRRLTSEQSMRLPYAKSAVTVIEHLAFCLVPPAGEETKDVQAAVAAQARGAARRNRWRNAKNKKRKRMFGMKNKKGDASIASTAAEEDDDSSDPDDDMPPLIAADGWEASLGAVDQVSGVPTRAICELSGTLMSDPMMTPDGHVFDRVSLEDWMTTSATNPRTGAPLAMADCVPAAQIAEYIQGYQLQMMSVGQLAPEAVDQPTPTEVAMEAAIAAADPSQAMPAAPPAAAAPVATGPSLLGDLPSLGSGASATGERTAKKERNKIKITSRSVVECPEEMRCAIDGKVCINPVRSPYGHLFEQKTLQRWMSNCGSVCPVTQRPLRMDECAPDSDMKKRIVKFLKNQQE
mmetsp:Transcript_8672/g.16203  ORF Transcript_8672/g.16203 Transcript_8672/m.16203 type:complete len:762 (+) Transcript_8672:109-2394(+)